MYCITSWRPGTIRHASYPEVLTDLLRLSVYISLYDQWCNVRISFALSSISEREIDRLIIGLHYTCPVTNSLP